ncbi:transcriptional activation factor TAFII32 [Gracilaria domingensis]|nr:transcriptional activation factor TAFII32 [Gracilaria domingensis]
MEAQAGKPRDARIIEAILRAMGVDQYDPRVVNQLLELLYRYVSGVLLDARNVCEHTFKTQIDAEDIKLAIKSTCSHSFLQPPPREVTMRIAAERNSVPLPQIEQMAGLSLPKPEFQLTEQNYDYVFDKNPASPVKRSSPTRPPGASPKRQRLSPHQRPHTEPPPVINRSPNSGSSNPTAPVTAKNTNSPAKKVASPAKVTARTNSPSSNRSLQQQQSSVQTNPSASPSAPAVNLAGSQQAPAMQTISAPMLATQPTTSPIWSQPGSAALSTQSPGRQNAGAASNVILPPTQKPPPS